MRVAYVVGTFPCRSETFIAREIAALEARGIEVVVFPLWPGPADQAGTHPVERVGRWGMREQFLHMGKHVAWQFRFMGAWTQEGRGALQALWHEGRMLAMGHRMRALGVERVHAHFGNVVSTAGWMAADVAGVPFSLSVHARDVFVEPQFVREKARAAVAVVACNSAAAARVRELVGAVEAEKVVHVPHGIPLEAYPVRVAAPSGVPLILAVGRLVEKKGFSYLLAAVARLRAAGRSFRAQIIGEGCERKALEREVTQALLGDVVTMPGWQSQEEVRRAMAEAAVLVAPSVVASDGDMDGLPNVLIEAAALGVPLVATDVGGLPDLVHDRETGLVVPPGDAEALATAIAAVLDDADAAMERATAARAAVEARFDATLCAERLAAVLGLGGG